MHRKRLIGPVLFVLLASIAAFCDLPAKAAAQTNAEQTVYVTRTGKKYHTVGCRYLKSSQIPMKLKDAVNAGYTPCSVCRPPTLKEASESEVPEEGETVSSESSLQQQLLDVEHQWVQTALDGDATAFVGLMADNYVALLPDGRTRDKASWVEGIRSGQMKYQSVELRNLKVFLHGDTAVVTGEFTQKGNSCGHDNSGTGAYVDTWVNRRGRWELIASGFTENPQTTQH
jgi:ketosteroid isomerase-like protein